MLEEANRPCIIIRFGDPGSVIHRNLLEKIFALGFSTRGGSGLGLYIVRSLLDSLGRRLQLEEGFVPLCTTFRIELPIARQGAEA